MKEYILDTSEECLIKLREGYTKKVAVLLDFVQMRGGALPKFLNPFHKWIFGQ